MAAVEKAYNTQPTKAKTLFLFNSIGGAGSIEKFVMFQDVGFNRFNLAFGDVAKGQFDDSAISNNRDVLSVLSTVAKCVHEFLEAYPGAEILIVPVDAKRAMLYNFVFKRRFPEITVNFEVVGLVGSKKEVYSPERDYDSFLLKHRFSKI